MSRRTSAVVSAMRPPNRFRGQGRFTESGTCSAPPAPSVIYDRYHFNLTPALSTPNGVGELGRGFTDGRHRLPRRKLRGGQQCQSVPREPARECACDDDDNERGEPVQISRQPLIADEQDQPGEECEAAEEREHRRNRNERRPATDAVQRFDGLDARETNFVPHQANAPLRQVAKESADRATAVLMLTDRHHDLLLAKGFAEQVPET